MDDNFPRRPRPSPNLEGLHTYAVPRAPAPTDLKLDSNEGAAPPPELLRVLAEAGPELMNRYVRARELEAELAAYHGVRPEQVLVTAGGDDAIDRSCRVFVQPDREVVLPVPTFEMAAVFARLSGGRIVRVPWAKSDFPIEEVMAAATERTGMIVAISPNNPTGGVVAADDLRRLSEAAPQALLLVDLAYADFADADLRKTVFALPNAIAVFTFSKAWGLAGLRVGYAIGPEDLIGLLRVAGGPYPVSSLSLTLAKQWLRGGREAVAAAVSRVRDERAELTADLARWGARPLPSQGNFVFAHCADPLWARDALAGLGVAVRWIPPDGDFPAGLRITCPSNETGFRRLQAALHAVLAPEALLFDMDGVLADVSSSYRAVMQAVLDFYGATVQRDEIAAAKLEPDANDDWELTGRLLLRHGVEVSLDEVTQRFEALYQGTLESPGLWTRETLLPAPELLDQLAAKLPLAVVTGRPRADAWRFLERHGLANRFRAVICREDAPLKPDPAPVRLALQKLSVRRAWLIGDASDDLRAARAAGVVPVGFLPAYARSDAAVAALHQAGAARVLTSLDELKEILP